MLGAIRDLNRLELAGETLRAALEALAAAAPGWLAGVIDASWQQVYGARIDDLHLPEGQARRREKLPGGDGLPPARAQLISPYDLDAVRRVVAHSECARRLEGQLACGLAA